MQFELIPVFGLVLLLGRLKFGACSTWKHALAAYGGACYTYGFVYWAVTDFSTEGLKGMEVITLGDTLISKHMDAMPEKEL